MSKKEKNKELPPPRREISDKLYLYVENESSVLDGDIDQVIARIAEFKKQLQEKHNTEKYIRYEMVVGRDYDGDTELRFVGVKLESDAQYAARLKQIESGKKLAEKNKKIAQQKRIEREKRDYERLKKKFEKK